MRVDVEISRQCIMSDPDVIRGFLSSVPNNDAVSMDLNRRISARDRKCRRVGKVRNKTWLTFNKSVKRNPDEERQDWSRNSGRNRPINVHPDSSSSSG